ncbi:thiopurine S-methyltransferase-like protein [Leptotrombidium deliense]|uniref:Thiopurine S-methyltransferase-like protein n=1 Tax=Leptotrombidium deliense TaxID=299467 RepID=A0A443S2M7_9ACAR|nr:thiopurine S-methyltransferase-like protein [Leptotrombidium deliense]
METVTKVDYNGNKVGAEYWQSCYDRNYTRWQIDTVHELLVKYIHLLEPHKQSTIFVPLCGKSVDIQW